MQVAGGFRGRFGVDASLAAGVLSRHHAMVLQCSVSGHSVDTLSGVSVVLLVVVVGQSPVAPASPVSVQCRCLLNAPYYVTVEIAAAVDRDDAHRSHDVLDMRMSLRPYSCAEDAPQTRRRVALGAVLSPS